MKLAPTFVMTSALWGRTRHALPLAALLACSCTGAEGGDSGPSSASASASASTGSGSDDGSTSEASQSATASGSAGTQASSTGASTDGAETSTTADSTSGESTDSDADADADGTTGGERLPPDDTPGELTFETETEIEGGWYQYYQGSTQYRPSGEVFAVAFGGDVTHVVNDSSSSAGGVRHRDDAEGGWVSSGNVTDPDLAYGPRSLSLSLDTNQLPSIGVGGIHYVNYPSSISSAHAYFYDDYLWNLHHPAPSMSGPAPRSLEMVVDGDNRRHVIYVARWDGNDDTLIYATTEDIESEWTLEAIAPEHDLTSLSQKSCALAVDASGDVHVVYTRDNPDAVGNESETVVSYARRVGPGDWDVELVEDYLLVRDRVDIAVAPDGTPHIAMAEDMFSAIWHATRVEGAWEAALVDDVGDVGTGHAIAVDDYGRPHISYVDRAQRQIRYARRISSGWDLYAPTDTFADGAGAGCGFCNTAIMTDLALDGTQPVIGVGGFNLSLVRATLD